MKIAIIGANGMLGSELSSYFLNKNQEVYLLTHGEIEVSDMATFEGAFGDFVPEIIINTACCHVAASEASPYQSFLVNAIGAYNVATYAEKVGAILVHYSTDYVFDGKFSKHVNEEEKPNPINTYGVSKLAGEQMVRNNCSRHFIIRTGAMYGAEPSRGKDNTNFVLSIIKKAKEQDKIEVVSNCLVSPTWTMQLAKNLMYLLDSPEYGTYHMVALGDGSYYDFAKLIVDELRLPATIVPVERHFGNTPQYPLLDNKNLEVIRINKMDFWDRALKRFLLNFEAV